MEANLDVAVHQQRGTVPVAVRSDSWPVSAPGRPALPCDDCASSFDALRPC